MATSGTVGTTVINCAQMIDSAFRRSRILPQLITSEHIATAKRLLWMKLSMLNTRGISLWAIDTQFLGLVEGQSDYLTPVGSLALLNSNLRQIQRIEGIASSSGGAAAAAYDQDLTTSCVESAPNGYITILFNDSAQFTQVGILPAASGVWNFQFQWNDGVAWHTFNTLTNVKVTAGTWLWYDVDAIPSAAGFKLQATGGTTLAVYEIVCGNTPSDIPMYAMDRDTWTQLPNKTFMNRPVQYYFDRRITTPIMHIWPTPASGYPLNFLIVNYMQRQLQDVGTLPQQIELPDRWYLPVIAALSVECNLEIKEADATVRQDLIASRDELLSEAWNGESNGTNARFMPNIGAYTR